MEVVDMLCSRQRSLANNDVGDNPILSADRNFQDKLTRRAKAPHARSLIIR